MELSGKDQNISGPAEKQGLVNLNCVPPVSRTQKSGAKGQSQRGPQGRALPYLPVLIGTCNRPKHLRKLLDSLARCYGAEKTTVYLAVDAPFSQEVSKAHKKVLHICKKKYPFRKTIIIQRKKNLGPAKNFYLARERIFRFSHSLILLEDDNVVAKNFLLFMNQANFCFVADPRCYAICAYHLKDEVRRESAADIYRVFNFAGWGVVLFRDRAPQQVPRFPHPPNPVFLNPKKLYICLRFAPHIFRIYMEAYLRGVSHTDIEFSLYGLARGLYCVYPTLTKTINRGFDGSGHRCSDQQIELPKKFTSQSQKSFVFGPDPDTDLFYLKQNAAWHFRNQGIRRYRIFSLLVKYLYHSLRGHLAGSMGLLANP